MLWYKIVDKSKGRYYALFHGTNGSKHLPEQQWLTAYSRPVRDGSGGTKYTSGWHVMQNLDECKKYLSKFTDNKKERVIVMVNVGGAMWPKEHSPANVYLCEEIFIIGEV